MPPPRVIPPTPTVGVSPSPVTRPCSPVAFVYSFFVEYYVSGLTGSVKE